MAEPRLYTYGGSVKSDVSDELINVYVLRPIAGTLVRLLYSTPITPNQVTLAAIAAGVIASALYFTNTPESLVLAGLCITLKDLLDTADGQLARAKQTYSRAGRFLDSIGDFLVNFLVFAAIGFALVSSSGEFLFCFLAGAGFVGTTFRVSYHVFYQTSFLHTKRLYSTNRTSEEVRPVDLTSSRSTLTLQRVFQLLYGWQDRLVIRIDRWCSGKVEPGLDKSGWFVDRMGLRLSGLLGLGTEMFLLTLASVSNQIVAYLFVNVIVMNSILTSSIVYRRVILRNRLASDDT